MPIDNPQLRTFANEALRPLADLMAAADLAALGAREEYDAKILGNVIEDGGPGELIVDGSETDGRTRVAGGDVYNLITLIDAYRAWLDANGRRDVLAKWQVNGYRPGA